MTKTNKQIVDILHAKTLLPIEYLYYVLDTCQAAVDNGNHISYAFYGIEKGYMHYHFIKHMHYHFIKHGFDGQIREKFEFMQDCIENHLKTKD